MPVVHDSVYNINFTYLCSLILTNHKMLIFNTMGLSPDLLKGIEELGFEKPTPIQEKILPIFFEKENDIVGLAQTGTGKTAAFGLPIIEQIDIGNKSVQALILSPTRELCIQISKDLRNYSKFIKGLQVVPVYGGASIDTQIRALKKGVHIIVATPGRMLDLINRKVAKIGNVKTVVLDEADEMLNMGFRDELDGILSKTSDTKRTLLFSATMPREVARIANNYMNDPVEITVGKQNAGAENINHIYYQVHARNRYLALKRIADINPDIYGLVFCRTRMETKEIADKLIKDGYNADALHGDLSQAQRDHVMKRFRDKSLQMLVATDVAARGIDVNDISHIINYNLPDELDIYTHRSGRTGRAGKSGTSILIVNYREVNRIPQIEKIIKKSFTKALVPSGKEICNKQLYKLIDKMENVVVDEEQIAPFLDSINIKLESLTKEQIIKRFVSLEFNRFIEYYKNAPDLNEKEERRERRDKRDRGDREERGKRRGYKGNYSRFFMNIGKKDGILPKNIIGMINDNTSDRDINIGSIDLKDSFSFFEVEEKYTSTILSSLNKDVTFKGREVKVDIAEDKDSSEKPEGKSRRREGSHRSESYSNRRRHDGSSGRESYRRKDDSKRSDDSQGKESSRKRYDSKKSDDSQGKESSRRRYDSKKSDDSQGKESSRRRYDSKKSDDSQGKESSRRRYDSKKNDDSQRGESSGRSDSKSRSDGSSRRESSSRSGSSSRRESSSRRRDNDKKGENRRKRI